MEFRHHMLKEIMEQPAVLSALAQRGKQLLGGGAAGLFGLSDEEAARVERVVFLACGTSYHAALGGKQMVETFAGLQCQVEYAHEYRMSPPLPLENCLVVGLSQSGETLDTLEAMRKAKQAGARLLAICNVADSAIVRLAHGAFLLEAGVEAAIASTKVFSAQWAALFLLALRLGQARGRLPEALVQKYVQQLAALPSKLSEVLESSTFAKEAAQVLKSAPRLLLVGRGLAYAIAMEGALKLKETCYLHAEAFAGGEFRHGPMALIEPGVPTLVLLPGLPEASFELMRAGTGEIGERGGEVWALAQKGAEALGAGVRAYGVPEADVFLSPLLFIAPLQMLAYNIAVHKGLDVDTPRGLCKAVVGDPKAG